MSVGWDNYLDERARREAAEAKLREVEDMRDSWADAVEGEGGWRAERDALREALEYYADEEHWSGPSGDEMVEAGCYFSVPAHEDRGALARAVLAKANGGSK